MSTSSSRFSSAEGSPGGIMDRCLRSGNPRSWEKIARGAPAELCRALAEEARRRVERSARKDPGEALRAADFLLWMSRRAPQIADPAVARRFRGHALRAAGRFREALGEYRRAAARFEARGDAEGRSVTAIGMVDALMFLGRYPEAIRVGSRARALFARRGDPSRAAKIDTNVGNVFHRLDRHVEALRRFDRARDAFASRGDRVSTALVDLNRANSLVNLNRTDEALEAYGATREVLEAEGAGALLAQIDYNTGYLRFLRGEYSEALRAFARARLGFEHAPDPTLPALCSLDEAEVHIRLGDPEEAERLAQDAGEVFRAAGMNYETGKSLLFRGVAAGLCGRSEEARATIHAAARAFAQEPNRVWRGIACLERASLDLVEERYREATVFAREAARLLPRRGGHRAYARLLLARAEVALGRTGSAAPRIRAVLREGERLRLRWLLASAHEARARMRSRAGDSLGASQALLRAARLIEEERAGIWSEEHRITFLAGRSRIFEDLVGVLLSLRKPAAAFHAAERAKSRALLETARDCPVPRAAARTPEGERALAEIGRLLGSLKFLESRTLREGESHRGLDARISHAGPREDPDREVVRTESELERAFRRLRHLEPALAATLSAGIPSARAVQCALGPGEILFEYFQVGDAFVRFDLTRETFQVERTAISVREVRYWLRALADEVVRERLAPGPREAGARGAKPLERLRQALLPALSGDGRITRIRIVPHGLLHAVPFGALLENGEPLATVAPVVTAPSSGLLLASLNRVTSHPRGALLVAVEDSGNPGMREEVEALARRVPDARAVTGDGATGAAFLDLAPAAALVHVASHARFRADLPQLSGIRFADGWLAARELYGRRFHSDVVVLSACESGRSGVTAGDEILGLLRAFLAAGVRTVVASLWPVSDRAARDLMADFYGGLLEGRTVGASLAAASRLARERDPHPFYWAPFIAVGADAAPFSSASPGGVEHAN